MKDFPDGKSTRSCCNALHPRVSEDAIPFCLTGHWLHDLFKLFFLCSALTVCSVKELDIVLTDLLLTPLSSVQFNKSLLKSYQVLLFDVLLWFLGDLDETSQGEGCLFAVLNCIDIRADPHSVGL